LAFLLLLIHTDLQLTQQCLSLGSAWQTPHSTWQCDCCISFTRNQFLYYYSKCDNKKYWFYSFSTPYTSETGHMLLRQVMANTISELSDYVKQCQNCNGTCTAHTSPAVQSSSQARHRQMLLVL